MRQFGLLGAGISYSRSPKIWESIWQEEGESNCHFDIIDTSNPVAYLGDNEEWEGLMVTTPYKDFLVQYMDILTPIAEEVGAINTIKRRDGLWIGHNTDVGGFLASITDLDIGEMAMVLGSGGASRAVSVALRSLGKEVIVVSRTPKSDMIGYEDVSKELLNKVTLIVNATPLGGPKHPDIVPNLPYEFIGKNHILYDLSYVSPNGFLNAPIVDCTKINGEEMLYRQARLAYDFFRD